MKAAVFKGAKNMVMEERPMPEIEQPTDAIVRVVRACVCGSDLWWYRSGEYQVNAQTGHESIGYIEEVGSEVTRFKKGDFVIVPFPTSCGICPVCKAGFESSCPNGGYVGTAQAQYVRTPLADGSLVLVPGDPKTFSDELLASLLTLSDVMSTGYHAAVSARVKAGDTAVVVGDGAVGLSGVLAAKLLGAERIIAMSRHADRQALAKEFGATDIVEERGDEAVSRVLDMTDGYGADAVLECVGSAQAAQTAFDVARRGAAIGRVGLPHDESISPQNIFYRNLIVAGGPAPVKTYDEQRLLQEVLDGNINPGKVFTQEFTLDEVSQAYQAMDERRAIKSLLRVSEV
ncbi:MAG: zinc-dependent alcohol dehydrogenase family protein [Bifidobacteriaceae bacterium]|nr:zinc-dependent alcohol dehydrogenase family protein [Bifidobacteriaceae bacterium]